MKSRAMITGASGFVGSHLLRHLLKNTDWDIVCPVTFTHRGMADRIRLALDAIPGAHERVKVVKCDLSTPISVVTDHEFGGIDYLFNVASDSHVDRSITHPAPFIINNVALICHLLDWQRMRAEQGRGARVIMQVSTDEVYGPADPGTAHSEWKDQHRPSNPYSASKAAQEDIAFSYWRTYDLPIVITNTMNIIGETQDPEKFFPKVLKSALSGEEMPIHASPEGEAGSRFYLHARNQADGLLYICTWVESQISRFFTTEESLRYSIGGGQPFRFHIVGEREVDNLTMATMIANAAGKDLNYRMEDFHGSRPGHDLRYALDGQKLAAIGWRAPVSLEDSILATVAWTRAHPEWLWDDEEKVLYDAIG